MDVQNSYNNFCTITLGMYVLISQLPHVSLTEITIFKVTIIIIVHFDYLKSKRGVCHVDFLYFLRVKM